jgi:polysaccharide export outer membrane protein
MFFQAIMRHKTYILLCVGLTSLSLIPHPAAAQQFNAPESNNAGALTGISASANGSIGENRNPSATSLRVGDGVPHYTLGVADVIHVSVWKNTELSQTVTIGPDGFISLPLLGDVKVEGFTTNQLGELLKSQWSAFIVNPQVTVSVVEIRSRQVYITGEVGRPGGYPLVAPMTVLQLIAKAGGLSPFADRKGIYILREGNGHMQRISFNYQEFIRGKNGQNAALQPGDTVIVP